MISCHEAKQFISQKLDGELTELENKHLEEHLSDCSECKIYEEELSVLHKNLFKLQNIELTESIVDSLLVNKIKLDKNGKTKQKFKQRFKPWHGIVAAAILIGLAIPMINSGSGTEMYSLEQSAENGADQFGSEALMDSKNEGFTAAGETSTAPMNEKIAADQKNSEEMGVMGIEATPHDGLYRVEEADNQLVIYKDDSLLFKTKQWEQGFSVQWEVINEKEIIYSLYDSENNLVEKNKINPLEKKEEKIRN